jgi:AraC-like DNA-binding protein
VTTYRTGIRTEALGLYQSGLSCRRVVAELKRRHGSSPSQNTIFEWCRDERVLRDKSRADELMNARRNGRNYDQVRLEARRLAEDHLWSIRRIARHLGVAKSAVKRAIDPDHHLDLSEAVMRRVWQAYLPDVDDRLRRRDEVIALRHRGATYPEISKATGLSPSTVFSYCRCAGLTGTRTKQHRPKKLEVAPWS